MLALGSVIAGAGVLLAGLLALVFRHPQAPRWTRPEVVVFLSIIPVTAMIGFGLGHVLYGTGFLLQGQGDLRELLVLVAVPVVVAFLWYALGINRRLRAYDAATRGRSAHVGAPLVQLAGSTDQPPESPAPATPPSRPTRKAA